MKYIGSVLIPLFAFLALAMTLGATGCKHPAPPEAPIDNLTVAKVQGEITLGMSGASVAEILGHEHQLLQKQVHRFVRFAAYTASNNKSIAGALSD